MNEMKKIDFLFIDRKLLINIELILRKKRVKLQSIYMSSHTQMNELIKIKVIDGEL